MGTFFAPQGIERAIESNTFNFFRELESILPRRENEKLKFITKILNDSEYDFFRNQDAVISTEEEKLERKAVLEGSKRQIRKRLKKQAKSLESAIQILQNKEPIKKKEKPKSGNFSKIKWNGSKSSFGWLFKLLRDNNLIESPNPNEPDNDTELAEFLLKHFEFETETNPNDFRKELGKGNTLQREKKKFFAVPDLQLILPKRNKK